ncbi:hypothetical protein CYMTET_33160, partial [Cymbomonas tetramitiformis]
MGELRLPRGTWMLYEQKGKEIDGHEVVLRMNSAPVAGFEPYVGSKTTLNMCNHFHATHMAGVGGKFNDWHDHDENRHYRSTSKAHRLNKNETLVLFEPHLSHAYYKLYEPLFQHRPPPLTSILSIDFITAANELWGVLLNK